MSTHELVEMSGYCLAAIRARGLRVHRVERLREFEERMRALGMPDPHPMLSARWNDFPGGQAAGLVLTRGGQDVGGVAAHYYDLGGQSLGDYWEESYRRLYGKGDASPVYEPAPLAETTITGKVVYLGQLFLTKAERDGVVSAALLRYIQAFCVIEWTPNWLYGFIRAEDVERGKAAQFGFTYQVPFAQLWRKEPETRFSTEYLVANDRRHVCHMASRLVRDPVAYVPGYATVVGEQKDIMKSFGGFDGP